MNECASGTSLRWLPDALNRLLKLPQRPTAICCANDKMAMRVYGLLADRGLSIPKDISVVGYDDYRVISEQLRPSLSSASLAYEQIGAAAALALLALASQPGSVPALQRVQGPIVWRDSVRSLS